MTYSAFGLILTGVLLNAAAQLALKASVGNMGVISLTMNSAVPVLSRLSMEPWLWAGLACYGISVIVWILALSRVDVSIAYPMLSIGYVVNAIAAWSLLGEAMTTQRIAGIAIIIVGVIVLSRS